MALLTSLRGGREETNLDLLLAKLVSEPGNGFPGTAANGFLVLLEVINQMNLPSSVDGDLVAGPDAQTGVVVRAKVHETFASSRVCLFVDGARDGKLGGEAALRRSEEAWAVDVAENGVVDVNSRRLSTRGDVGTSGGGDAVLDVGPGDGVGVVRLDVEDDGHDVELEPEPGAEVGGLDRE